MILKNKNAIIFGGGGSLGSAVARAFAKNGARVFLAGRHVAPVKLIAEKINAEGGKAESAEVDALNEKAVNEYVKAVASKAGTVDISFNAISWYDLQGVPLTEMSLTDFARPISISIETQFITSTAAARIMIRQGHGVILSLTATPGGIGYANIGGFGPACCAVESFSRNLGAELGPYNVRVVNMRSGGSPDSKPFVEALENNREAATEFIRKIENDTMLKKLPLREDIGNLASFLASDLAGKITGVTIDITSGTTAALNYKVTPIAFVHDGHASKHAEAR